MMWHVPVIKLAAKVSGIETALLNAWPGSYQIPLRTMPSRYIATAGENGYINYLSENYKRTAF